MGGEQLLKLLVYFFHLIVLQSHLLLFLYLLLSLSKLCLYNWNHKDLTSTCSLKFNFTIFVPDLDGLVTLLSNKFINFQCSIIILYQS